ncbi:MAG: hypothetical protein ACPG49_11500, partial [Chitinophagales bacterium]
ALIEYEKEKGAYEVQEKQYQLNTLNFKKELKGYQKASEERKKLVYKHIQRVSIMQKIENQYGYTWSIMPEFKKEVFKNGLTSKSPSIVYKELMNRNRANFEFEIEYVAKELGLSKPEVAYHWSRVKYNRYLFNELREEYKDSYAITEIEELLENLDAKYYQKKEEMGIITSEDYDYFTTSVNQMSWINIDRWLKEKPIQKIFVEAEPNKNTRYFAVSHTFNSCLAVGQNLDSKKSPSIQLPIGEKFTLVGIKIENNQIWMGSENIEVGKGGNKVPLNFQEKSLTEFKDSFRELEKQRTI